ncbi:Drug/metabolite transporter [Corchorus olitorius]|uniref:WAT1-related protein n=1 Tax=Corchorus olitorius TaxID=93759 RepID=A0A1R3H2C5_9ROSI|nr:Drug/metabolite transporter [Corchorus olitorius]
MATRYFYKEVLPCTAMIAVECSIVVINILFKSASAKGLSCYIFIAYSYGLATIALIPLTFFLIRKAGLPQFKFPLIFRLFLIGLTGVAAELCVYKGLELGAPTLSSAISNLVPAFTFILAVFFSSPPAILSQVGEKIYTFVSSSTYRRHLCDPAGPH